MLRRSAARSRPWSMSPTRATVRAMTSSSSTSTTPLASISQPVRRLRGFQRVTLAPGAEQTVTFTLDKSDFGFYDNRGKFVVEPGEIDVFAGDSSNAALQQSFTVSG